MNMNKSFEWFKKHPASFITIFLGVTYSLGFLSWNSYLSDFQFFEDQLLQTRFISTGILVLLPPLVLLMIWWTLRDGSCDGTKKDVRRVSDAPSRAVWVLATLFFVYTWFFSGFIFPIVPQHYGGGKPFPASIIAEKNILDLLSDLTVELAPNGEGKPFRQTTSVCILYSNKDVLLIGVPKISRSGDTLLVSPNRIFTLKKDQILGLEFGHALGCAPSFQLEARKERGSN